MRANDITEVKYIGTLEHWYDGLQHSQTMYIIYLSRPFTDKCACISVVFYLLKPLFIGKFLWNLFVICR